jgi:hypothetical protein
LDFQDLITKIGSSRLDHQNWIIKTGFSRSPCFRKFNFRVLPVGGVDDGRAADLRDSLSVSVETPAADLVRPDHIFDELKQTFVSSEIVLIDHLFC